MSVMHFRIQMPPLIKESVSIHHPIIYTGLKDLTPMIPSINMMDHLVFNELMEFKEKNQLDDNGI